jgi:hypothetical protein
MKSVSKDIIVYICSYLTTRDKCMLLRALGRDFYYWGRTSVVIWPNLTAKEIIYDRQRTQIVKDIRFDFQYGRYTMFLGNRRAYVYIFDDLEFAIVTHEFSMSARKRNRIILCSMPLPTICDDDMLSYFTQHFFSHLFDKFGAKLFFGVGINPTLEIEEEVIHTQNKELRYQLGHGMYGYETDPWIDCKEQRIRKFEKRYKAKRRVYI